MPVAPHLLSISISNYRSIVEPLEVPLKSKMTFLVGQNNSGKTGVMRFLADLLNGAKIREEDRSSLTSTPASAVYKFSTHAIEEFASNFKYMKDLLNKNRPPEFIVTHLFGAAASNSLGEGVHKIMAHGYFNGGHGGGRFMNDFGQSSSDSLANVAIFFNQLWPKLSVPQTVYIPSHRLILQAGKEIPQFGQIEFPGNKIQMNNIVIELARLDRPHGTPAQRDISREKLAKICDFLKYCLEVDEVRLGVPDEKQTIYVAIDNNEQPISNLGSGIEQLIVIGMGSFMFPGYLVLIDEPEIHFHPRTQKRMMNYLYENADAKFLIATHSAAILDSVEADVVQIWQDDQMCFGRTVQNNSDLHKAVSNLGHTPSELVLANFIIWVEGPSDRIYFNHWIKKLDASLVEGIDYAIIFYGGSVLARHSFEDDDDNQDLVKALSVSRNFAVYMDSDKTSEAAELKQRVKRVESEATTNEGWCWISEGREIENYIPQSVISQLDNFKTNALEKFGRVVDGNFDKVKFAEKAVTFWGDEWPLDLKAKCEALVDRISAAR